MACHTDSDTGEIISLIYKELRGCGIYQYSTANFSFHGRSRLRVGVILLELICHLTINYFKAINFSLEEHRDLETTACIVINSLGMYYQSTNTFYDTVNHDCKTFNFDHATFRSEDTLGLVIERRSLDKGQLTSMLVGAGIEHKCPPRRLNGN